MWDRKKLEDEESITFQRKIGGGMIENLERPNTRDTKSKSDTKFHTE